MTRPPDPTAERTVTSTLVEAVRGALDGLRPVEREILVLRYGLRDGQPRTIEEIMHALQLSRMHVWLAESRARRVLSDPAMAREVQHLADEEGADRVLRDALVVVAADGVVDLVHCDRHGWSDPTGVMQCASCPCRVVYGLLGRRPRYCSDACRQVAYRRRRAERKATQAAEPDVG